LKKAGGKIPKKKTNNSQAQQESSLAQNKTCKNPKNGPGWIRTNVSLR